MGKNQKNHQNLLEITPNLIQNESGRSMVEMLGVLAIVGVLSVGAISGYRYAMNKYRANQTVNELNLLSHQVAIAMMSTNGVTELKLGDPYDTEHKLTSTGYSFEFGCGDGTTLDCTGIYHFNVQNVSEGVCKELVQMSEHMQFIKDHPTDCNTTNLNFVFKLPEAVGNNGHVTEEPEPPEEETFTPAQKETCFGQGMPAYGKCECFGGFTGSFCQTREESCSGHGTFSDGCVCDTGRYGYNCQYSVTECEKHGSFESYPDYWKNLGSCQCDTGWAGEECSIPNETVCKNGSVWWNANNGHSIGRCVCEDGFYGDTCESQENPCQNGTWDSWYGYCECTDNFEGIYCNYPQGTICQGNSSWDSYDLSCH